MPGQPAAVPAMPVQVTDVINLGENDPAEPSQPTETCEILPLPTLLKTQQKSLDIILRVSKAGCESTMPGFFF